MNLQELALRWLHILAAISLVGGTFFWRWALVPSLASLDEADRQRIQAAIRPKWARIVMIASALLLVSGMWNGVSIIKANAFDGSLYHAFIGVKLLLALLIMWIAARLSGRSQGAERFREKQVFWLTINVVLSIVIVCVAGVMKFTPRTPKAAEPAVEQTAVVGDLDDKPAFVGERTSGG